MHSVPYKTNSDFQTKHFLAGSCYTADGAWGELYNQRETIRAHLDEIETKHMELQADLLDAQELAATAQSEAQKLRASATLRRTTAALKTSTLARAGAESEIAAIDDLMASLEPSRKYAGLAPEQAIEAAQRDEWREELRHRSENFLLANVTGIPHDQIHAMRMHPDFYSSILPHIREVHELITSHRMEEAVRLIEGPKLSINAPIEK